AEQKRFSERQARRCVSNTGGGPLARRCEFASRSEKRFCEGSPKGRSGRRTYTPTAPCRLKNSMTEPPPNPLLFGAFVQRHDLLRNPGQISRARRRRGVGRQEFRRSTARA